MQLLPDRASATSPSRPSSFISTTRPRPSSFARAKASASVGISWPRTRRGFQFFEVQLFHQPFAVGGPVHTFIVHQDKFAVAGEPDIQLDIIGFAQCCGLDALQGVLRRPGLRLRGDLSLKPLQWRNAWKIYHFLLKAGKGLYFKRDTRMLNA